jgi:hypothetical protein
MGVSGLCRDVSACGLQKSEQSRWLGGGFGGCDDDAERGEGPALACTVGGCTFWNGRKEVGRIEDRYAAAAWLLPVCAVSQGGGRSSFITKPGGGKRGNEAGLWTVKM